MTEKNLNYYMKLKYNVKTKEVRIDDDYYIQVYIPELPGLEIYVTSYNDVDQEINSAKKEWFASRIAQEKDIPEPIRQINKTGRVTLRMSRSLHEKVSYYADEEGVSLNQYLNQLIEDGFCNSKMEQIYEELRQIGNFQNDLNKTIHGEFQNSPQRLNNKIIMGFNDVSQSNRIDNQSESDGFKMYPTMEEQYRL
ncbi:toxin-antitoxin system HicB family antitoxin [Companilactobacillus paralimentarius]|uniref:toxin-antitoxin system HicB family antitoxin n=1 Tax=Companilactobacillus paralimentarius TaxID=83526 RepID=UPI002853117C|nr:toxin-antitoxin system HicB family antitoxin [Companilactobacillus paralimentarius]MDR4934408.1 toxin-antitoxin system HicB family antitoxin [Companilactobacillus paralimentarius]